MSALHKLAEALARIEHKVDVLLHWNFSPQHYSLLAIPQLKDFSHSCPICCQTVQYLVDPGAEILIRKCGCATGKQAPIKLEAFAPPPPDPSQKGSRYGSFEEADRSGSDSDGERRGPAGSGGGRR